MKGSWSSKYKTPAGAQTHAARGLKDCITAALLLNPPFIITLIIQHEWGELSSYYNTTHHCTVMSVRGFPIGGNSLSVLGRTDIRTMPRTCVDCSQIFPPFAEFECIFPSPPQQNRFKNWNTFHSLKQHAQYSLEERERLWKWFCSICARWQIVESALCTRWLMMQQMTAVSQDSTLTWDDTEMVICSREF